MRALIAVVLLTACTEARGDGEVAQNAIAERAEEIRAQADAAVDEQIEAMGPIAGPSDSDEIR